MKKIRLNRYLRPGTKPETNKKSAPSATEGQGQRTGTKPGSRRDNAAAQEIGHVHFLIAYKTARTP